MNYVDLVLRWMHILAATTMVGGTLFLRFAWFPSVKDADASTRESQFSGMRSGWAKLVMLSTLFLLVSGLINAVNNIKRYDLGGAYHGLVLAKLLIALALFFLSARVAGRSESAQRFRTNIGKWLTINSVLALLLVLMGGFMKVTPHPPKMDDGGEVDTSMLQTDESLQAATPAEWKPDA